ncbi:uncharacterized protein LOC119075593 [Bradysia coprophila]|uniref:uncharacterized protein LOC119075593 n=1 Tax=Bradysia coprophila TaxID=38358 RepID=UPI00187DB7CF|nr:uncharacterized protein LOC119075593 [Bradysia coprophila]
MIDGSQIWETFSALAYKAFKKLKYADKVHTTGKLHSYVTFLESPTVTSESPIKTPILELNFPAVSVCNANRISRQALVEYSSFINQHNFNHTIPTFKAPERVNSHGSNFGLTFLVDNQLQDYVFTMNAFIGTVVLIFDANDFPDQLSGAVREKIISPQQEVYLSLNPTLIRGSRSMKTFEISSRNCVFNDEINLVFAK